MDRMKEKFTPQGFFFENELIPKKIACRDIFFLGRRFLQAWQGPAHMRPGGRNDNALVSKDENQIDITSEKSIRNVLPLNVSTDSRARCWSKIVHGKARFTSSNSKKTEHE